MNADIVNTGRAFHRFAWDSMSFQIPEDWNLSYHHVDRRTSSIRMEDDDVVRLEQEWVVLKQPIETAQIMARYKKGSEELEDRAEKCAALTDLPAGWTGFLYDLPEARELVTLMWLGPDRRFFSFIRLHFKQSEVGLRADVVSALTTSFQLHTEARVPWEVYDMAIEVDRSFELMNTTFNAGQKMLAFRRDLTRLYVWQFSLADMLLKGRTAAEWAAKFLNGFKPIRAVRFVPQDDGTIAAVRKRQHLFGHYDEIWRACFQYRVGVTRLASRNAILLWVYSFRSQRDLAALGSWASAA